MPRYFFDTFDQEERVEDDQGIECSTKADIAMRAIDALPDMARDELPNGTDHDFRVEVRGQDGKVIFRASLKLRSEWLVDCS